MKHLALWLVAVHLAMAIVFGMFGTAMGESEEEYVKTHLFEEQYTEKELYQLLLSINYETNDYDLIDALEKWLPYTSIEILNYEDNSDAKQISERYVIGIHVEDAVVDNYYQATFDNWVNREYEEGEYYTCDLQVLSTSNKLRGVTWTSRSNNGVSFEADARPDGKLAVIRHYYDTISLTEGWKENYSSIVSLMPIEDSRKVQPYGYEVDFGGYYVNCMLYPDGTVYYALTGDLFYISGTEEQINSVDLSSGNTIGATSSNLFNGGMVAIEGEYMAYATNNSVYRVGLDGSNEMCLLTGAQYIRSLNIINGEVYFTCQKSAAYGYDLNGNQLFEAKGDIMNIVADPEYIVYTVASGSDSGVYRYDKRSGQTDRLTGIKANNVSLDGEWIYFDGIYQEDLYRIKRDGYSIETVYSGKKTGGFIAQDGYVLFYVSDAEDMVLHKIEIYSDGKTSLCNPVASYKKFGGVSAYVGSDRTKKIAEKDGWIYYYYARDNSMICRLALDGSVDEEFVCYTNGNKNGIYIFGNLMYLQGGSNLFFTAVLDDVESGSTY